MQIKSIILSIVATVALVQAGNRSAPQNPAPREEMMAKCMDDSRAYLATECTKNCDIDPTQGCNECIDKASAHTHPESGFSSKDASPYCLIMANCRQDHGIGGAPRKGS